MKSSLRVSLLVLLCLTVCLCLAPAASAETIYGTWGDNLIWTLENGVLTVTGRGEMADFASDSTEAWRFYTKDITALVIEDGVTGIGYGAFHDCDNLSEVLYVGTQEQWAALRDNGIDGGNAPLLRATLQIAPEEADFVLPEGLTEIGEEAFAGINARIVYIPEGVGKIGSRAFANCPNLKKLIFANGDIEVAENFVSGCDWRLQFDVAEGTAVYENIDRFRGYLTNPNELPEIEIP